METRNLLACCLLVAACITTVAAQGYSTLPPGVTGGPFWRILCPNQALFSGFADPIVTPGNYSSHVHRVFGASRFGFGASPVDTVAYYNYILESECTQCNIIADKSLYWVPELYYMYPNGSLTLVPDGGLTIYYLSRGTGPWTAIPPGLRMTAGSPTRRSFDPTQDSNLAVSYVCIGAPDGYNPKYNSQPPYFPTNETVCSSVRGQIWFPNCWNGTFLDSANHQSHMSYPLDGPGGGNCPPDFPIKFPGVFYEINFPTPVATFPHGPGAQGKFVFSTGDATGESLHGDFVNGWDVNVLQNALDDISCYASPTNGGSVNSCNTLVPYINPTSDCQLEQPLPTIIDYGYNHLIGRVPGCNNPVTLVEGPIVPDCFDIQPENPVYNGVLRVVLKSVSNGQFLSLWNFTTPVTANAGTDIYNLSYSSVFLLFPNPVGAPAGLYSIYNEQSLQYCTASVGGTTGFTCNKNSPSGWEFFSLNFNADRSVVSILANSNNKTLSLQSNGQYYNNAGTVTATEQFMVYDANAVAVVRPPQQVVPGSSNPGSTTGASSSASSFVAAASVVGLAVVVAAAAM